jgi:hypothetical protein
MLDVGNDVFYKRVKFHLETPYILGGAKKKKKLKSEVVNIANSETPKNYQILSFLCHPKYEVF